MKRELLALPRKDIMSMAKDLRANPKIKTIMLPIGYKK